nr:putative ribonuclease H-like domain-containing protein [Tanacetum cinerariifolium]
MFDLDYQTNSLNYEPVSVENQANKSAGPKEANNSVGTQANDDQGANSKEIDLHEEHLVLPIWSAYSNTVKSSGDKIEKNTNFKTSESPRKEATHDIQNANTSSTNLLNTFSIPLSTVGPSRAFNDGELSYPNDPSMPHLEDIYASPSERIFIDSSYDDECVVTDFNNLETTMNVSPTPTTRIHTIHPKTQILGDPISAVQTRSKVNNNSKAHTLIYLLERKQLGLNGSTGTRRMKRVIEAIRIFLAFAFYRGFIFYQMDVKSTFLYGTIDEEVYMSQPPGFLDPKFPNKVYKVVKALYHLHQAPEAWYATLSTFLEKSRYRRGAIDKTLFIKQDKKDIMLVQVYVDDIMFSSTKKSWCDEFEQLMKNRFQMCPMGELTFFLGLQTTSTPIETQKPLVKDKEAVDVDVHLYRDTYEKKLIQVLKIHTYDNVAGLLTKDFDVSSQLVMLALVSTGRQQHSTARHKVSTAGISKTTPLFLSMLTQAAVEEGKDSRIPIEFQPIPFPTQPNVRDQPPLTESSSDHDSSQDPRVDLEVTGRSGRDQVNLPHDSPFLGGHTSDRAEGSLNLEALSAICTNLSNRVLALETVKDAQAKKILTLKSRLKKLEKRCKPSSSQSMVKECLSFFIEEKVKPYVSTARLEDDNVRPDVSTARNKLSTAGPTTTLTTSTIFDDEEITLAYTLIKLKDDKAKGVAFKYSESTYIPARLILTLKPLPTIDPKDKGKGVLEEPESAKKMTKSDFDATQIARDEEIARQLEVEFQEDVERERQREEQASIDMNS